MREGRLCIWSGPCRSKAQCDRIVHCADRDGTVLDNPPLPEEISADPLLGALKLIAWSGNNALLPRSGTRGFPHWGVWLERNARFSADLAPFVAGLPATASGMATRCQRSHSTQCIGETAACRALTFQRLCCALREGTYFPKSSVTLKLANVMARSSG